MAIFNRNTYKKPTAKAPDNSALIAAAAKKRLEITPQNPAIKPIGFANPNQPNPAAVSNAGLNEPKVPKDILKDRNVLPGTKPPASSATQSPIAGQTPEQRAAFDETAQGKDLNGDGKIGDREMTNQELQDAAIRKLLEGGASPEQIAAERKAMQDKLAVQQAQSIQSTRARAGLGGGGLTGATAQLEGQVRSETSRDSALAMADFERQQRAEAAQRALQGMDAARAAEVYGIELAAYETEMEKDLNGDGVIGAVSGKTSSNTAVTQTPGESATETEIAAIKNNKNPDVIKEQQNFISYGADYNGDGAMTPAEKARFEKERMDGITKSAEQRKNGGSVQYEPQNQPPGNGWIMISPGRVDREGNTQPAVMYNPQTGKFARYSG